ncbi:TRAP transporter large permease [Oceanobacillus longus]|uniref:TRAP transporter large permease n=1 Tax=Oceanobacillus longus TaxID=930120 RepID=A0ABV8H2F5_9BACI
MILLFSIFFILLLLRVPVAISLAVSSIIMLLQGNFNLDMFAHRMFSSLDSFTLMTIPGFVLAGVILAKGGITKYLIEAIRSWIAHLPGGLSVVAILACMFFASISGSSPATAAAVGAIMIPSMIKNNYSAKYSMGIVAAGGTLGILLPPSIALIMYGVIAQVSIGDLFIAGIIPGILLGLALVTVAIFFAWKNGYKSEGKSSWAERGKHSLKAIWGAFLPFIILGSIYSGVATPTEAAVISVFYALFVSVFIYKELLWKDVRPILVETINITSMIFLIIGAASLFSLYLTNEQIPQQLGQWIQDANMSKTLFFISTGILFFILGMFLDPISVIVITLPIFLPVLEVLDINSIHFAIVMTINIELAMITPPVGLNLFVVSSIARKKMGHAVQGVLPFMLVMVFVLIIIIAIPSISTWLPQFMK